MKTIFRAFREAFRCAPVCTSVTIASYFIQGIFPAIFTQSLIQVIEYIARGQAFGQALVTLILAFFLNMLFSALNNMTMNAGVFEKTDFYLRAKLSLRYADLPLLSFEEAHTQDNGQKAQEAIAEESAGMLVLSLLQVSQSVVCITALACLLGSYHPLFVPVALSGIAVALAVRAVRGVAYGRLRERQASQERGAAYFFGLFAQTERNQELRVFDAAPFLKKKWAALHDTVCEAQHRFRCKDADAQFLCALIKTAAYLLAWLLVFWLCLSKAIALSVVAGALTSLKTLQDSADSALQWLQRLLQSLRLAANFFAFVRPEKPAAKATRPPSPGAIKLSHVSFSYPNAQVEALHDIDLLISPGERVAIVGENGSGKTTLSKLLTGAFPPKTGDIRMGSQPLPLLHQVDAQAAALFSVVPQSVIPYPLSLGESATFLEDWKPQAARITETLRALSFDPYVLHAHGLGVQLGRAFGGIQLSGGQEQTLSIARCALRNAPFLVLDEPTSAIDPLREEEIFLHFLHMAHGKTCLVVTHRMSLCQQVDRIIVLRAGRLVESGSHTALMAKHGVYWRLFTAQSKPYAPTQAKPE